MSLETALMNAGFTDLTDAEALAYGNETVVVGGTDELWSYSGVALEFGDAAAEGLLQAIEGAGLVGAAQVYLGRGMQLSLPQVQEKLTAIGQAVPALSDLCAALKEIGITHGTRWQLLGVDQPTLEQIAAARQNIITAAERDRIVNAWTAVSNAVADGSITTFDQAVELFGQQ